MPKIEKITDNTYRKVNTGADFNRALGVLKDELVILDADMVLSRIVPTNFKYLMGSSELEVYLNGTYMRINEEIDGITYGDYDEHTNFSVQFNAGNPDFIVGAQIRFRVTSANYKITNVDSVGGGQVNSDWNAASGVAMILNKPSNFLQANGTHIVTVNTVLTSTDFYRAFEMNNALARSFTLPAVGTVSNGDWIKLKNIGAGITTVIGTVDGIVDPELAQNDEITIYSDGLSWRGRVVCNADWDAVSGASQILNKPSNLLDANDTVIVTTNTVLTSVNFYRAYEMNSAGSRSFTLPAVGTVNNGDWIKLKNISTGTTTVIGTVDGIVSPTLSQNDEITIYSDGLSWRGRVVCNADWDATSGPSQILNKPTNLLKAFTPVTKTDTWQLSASEFYRVYQMNNAASKYFYLPDITTVDAGDWIKIKNIGAGNLTIKGLGGASVTIDGTTDPVLNQYYEIVIYKDDLSPANWRGVVLPNLDAYTYTTFTVPGSLYTSWEVTQRLPSGLILKYGHFDYYIVTTTKNGAHIKIVFQTPFPTALLTASAIGINAVSIATEPDPAGAAFYKAFVNDANNYSTCTFHLKTTNATYVVISCAAISTRGANNLPRGFDWMAVGY